MSQSTQNFSVLTFGATGGIDSALARQLAKQGCRFTLAARGGLSCLQSRMASNP